MEKIVIDSSKFPVHGLDREGPRVAYTSSLLDRADRNREDGRWLESHRHHPDTLPAILGPAGCHVAQPGPRTLLVYSQ